MIVVMPMAGRGSRFVNQGFEIPKPLIPVREKPMFAWALKSLEGVSYSKIVFIALAEHEERFQLSKSLQAHSPSADFELILLEDVTEGQLATVMKARALINKEEGLLILSSDTWVTSNIGQEIRQKKDQCAGLISVANMPGDRWSFAATDSTGKVTQVAEKVRISNHASTGLYYFASGRHFVQTAEEMMSSQEKTKGEYYVIPVYQKWIDRGEWVGISQCQQMWDMGTPSSKLAFEKNKDANFDR